MSYKEQPIEFPRILPVVWDGVRAVVIYAWLLEVLFCFMTLTV